MKKRKITITVERTYTKLVAFNINVDENITGENLIDFLVENKKLDKKIEKALKKEKFNDEIEETEYSYEDKNNDDGGHF